MSSLTANEFNANQEKKTGQIIKQVPEGYLITEGNYNLNSVILNLVSKLFYSFFSLALFSQFLGVLERSPLSEQFLNRLFVIFLGICLIISIYNLTKYFYTVIDQILVSLSFAPPELIFTNYPLSLGEEVSILFRRRLRSGKIIRTAGIVNANLACIEDVLYYRNDKDDNLTFASEKVIDRHLPEVLVPAYESAIEVLFNFKIPVDASATFEAKNNQINWILDIFLDFPKLLKEGSKFYLQVQPQIFLAK